MRNSELIYNAIGRIDKRSTNDTIYFFTAWSNVTQIIIKLSLIFPIVEIEYSYCNEEFGTGVGMIKFRNTRIIEEYIPNDYSKEAYEGSLEIEKSKPEDYNIIFDEN
ncbi:TPA: hypothetical protein KON48_002133 [Clostridioides difficile]|nr:hypothetical protein [Clostridioides difficile]HBF4280981.1 hypothetical protein [Clostridioides difficile]HCQ5685457.1 hypothetical protein [Clostridioides difficile]HDX7085970.1 hypothetical protein [Clostridioides difficile]